MSPAARPSHRVNKIRTKASEMPDIHYSTLMKRCESPTATTNETIGTKKKGPYALDWNNNEKEKTNKGMSSSRGVYVATASAGLSSARIQVCIDSRARPRRSSPNEMPSDQTHAGSLRISTLGRDTIECEMIGGKSDEKSRWQCTIVDDWPGWVVCSRDTTDTPIRSATNSLV